MYWHKTQLGVKSKIQFKRNNSNSYYNFQKIYDCFTKLNDKNMHEKVISIFKSVTPTNKNDKIV